MDEQITTKPDCSPSFRNPNFQHDLIAYRAWGAMEALADFADVYKPELIVRLLVAKVKELRAQQKEIGQ